MNQHPGGLRHLLTVVFVTSLLAGISTAGAQLNGLQQGLVAYFPFELQLSDAGPSPTEVKPTGEIQFQPGVRGQCAVFDGHSHLAAADKPGYDLTEFSFAVWVYHFRPNLRGRILERGTSDGYWLYIEGDRVTTGFFDGAYKQLVARTKIPEERWTFLCTTYDGQKLRYYQDGSLEAEVDVTGRPWQKKGPLHIGTKEKGAGFDFLLGGIDELRIYNRALSPAEVNQLFAQENL